MRFIVYLSVINIYTLRFDGQKKGTETVQQMLLIVWLLVCSKLFASETCDSHFAGLTPLSKKESARVEELLQLPTETVELFGRKKIFVEFLANRRLLSLEEEQLLVRARMEALAVKNKERALQIQWFFVRSTQALALSLFTRAIKYGYVKNEDFFEAWSDFTRAHFAMLSSYRPRDTKISTYIVPWLWKTLKSWSVRKAKKQKWIQERDSSDDDRGNVSNKPDSMPSPVQNAIAAENIEILSGVIEVVQLSPIEKDILLNLLALCGSVNLKELASKHGLSEERIKEEKNLALRKLRTYLSATNLEL